MALWAIGAVACGLAQGFWSLLLARMLVGSGRFPSDKITLREMYAASPDN